MAMQNKHNAATPTIVNVSVVLILAYSIFIIAGFLRAKAAVCSTTAPGVDLSIAFSVPTIFVGGVRCYLIIRQRSKSFHTISPSTASPKLESACAAIVQFLVLFWVILACVNLLIAIRAPVCLDQPLAGWHDNLKEQSWRYGVSCRLHRGLVALSVLMALSIVCLSYFDSVDRQHNRRRTSLINCYFTCGKPPKNHPFTSSVCNSRSGSSLGKDPLYLIPERSCSRFEQEHWQRRYSLSSQKAIYPHRYQWYDQRPRYAPHSLRPSRYSSTLRSVSEGPGMELSDRNSSMTSSQSGNTWATVSSTRPSTTSSLPRSRASSNPERGDLRREKGGESMTATAGVPEVPPMPTIPPPAWAPTLHHTPLSADPTLRALATGKASRPTLPHSKSSPDLAVQPLKIKRRESSLPAPQTTTLATIPVAEKHTKRMAPKPTPPRKQSAPSMSVGPPPAPHRPPNHPVQSSLVTSAAPAIPTRAPGHFASPSTVRAQINSTVSTSTTSRPSLSTAPSSASTSTTNHRRPDPIRYRQYHHHPYPNSNCPGRSQTQLPPHQYQHQQVWRHRCGVGQGQRSRNPSVYSASSYGTHGTDARTSMTRGAMLTHHL